MRVLGIDEAGYGPNLGPLVVTASIWEFADHWTQGNWESAFRQAWRDIEGIKTAPPRIDDSKRLFSPSKGIQQLEQVVLGALCTEPTPPSTAAWPTSWPSLCERLKVTANLPIWHHDIPVSLPLAATEPALADAQARWRLVQEQTGIRLVSVRAKILFPEDWNEGLEQEGNKATLLSRTSIALLRDSLHDPLAATDHETPTQIWCDRHGGRLRYAPFLWEVFPDRLIDVVTEMPRQSTYRFRFGNAPIEVSFCCDGEQFLPVALASMVSKYVREVSMKSFNEFWRRQLPELKPTAGYPQDAKRFRADVDFARRQLGITDRSFWRAR